jgi:hypothetical protein
MPVPPIRVSLPAPPTICGDPIRADVDGRRTHDARKAVAIALVGRHRAVVIEGNVRRPGRQNEVEVGDFVPGFQRRLRKKLLRCRQSGDVVGAVKFLLVLIECAIGLFVQSWKTHALSDKHYGRLLLRNCGWQCHYKV